MSNFLRKIRGFSDILKLDNVRFRNYSSALFIPGNKATETFSLFSPYLDFDRRFEDLDNLKKQIALRGLEINPAEMKETWEFYKYVDANRWSLEHQRMQIGKRMEDLMKKKVLSQVEEDEIVALKAQGKVLKQDLKTMKETLWDLEDSVVVRALKLPNEIDDRTPEKTCEILKTIREIPIPPQTERKSHLEIGTELGVVEYKNPLQYYLCNEAALFELGALSFCGEVLGEDMIRIAGADFSRSMVVEGSGLDHEDPTESFILADNEAEIGKNSTANRMHLVGGASLVSFLAMHTKQLINPKNFPLRYFATGRQYTPFPHGSSALDGLFTVCQSSAAHAFSLVKESGSEEYKAEFENLLEKVTQIYDKLGIHYRIVMRSAPNLRPWESLKVSFELWSAFNQQYIEVGFIAASGDFISKRLLIAYQTSSGRDFPAIISGPVLSVPRLLACLLEQNPQKLVIPECFKLHV